MAQKSAPLKPLVDKDTPKIGDNSLATEGLTERLTEEYRELETLIESIATRANSAPKEIKDDDQNNFVSEIVKDATLAYKRTDKTREDEKAPFLLGGRKVDGFFNAMLDRLDRVSKVLHARVTDYLNEKDRKAREEARRLAAEEDRKAADRRREAAEAQKKADAAAAAERAKTAQKHESKSAQHTFAAESHDQKAAEATAVAATAKPADLARTRAPTGTLSTLRTEWTHEITDYEKIDVSKLKQYLKRDAVDAAIRMAVKTGIRELDGVRIFEQTKSHIR